MVKWLLGSVVLLKRSEWAIYSPLLPPLRTSQTRSFSSANPCIAAAEQITARHRNAVQYSFHRCRAREFFDLLGRDGDVFAYESGSFYEVATWITAEIKAKVKALVAHKKTTGEIAKAFGLTKKRG
jgi:hypothetical protein